MTQTSMPIYNMVTKYHITRTVCGSNINKWSPIRSQPPLRIQSPLQHTRNMGGKHPSLWQRLDWTFTRKQHRPSLVDKLISTQEEFTSCTYPLLLLHCKESHKRCTLIHQCISQHITIQPPHMTGQLKGLIWQTQQGRNMGLYTCLRIQTT